MIFRISINGGPARIVIGNRDVLMDAAYDDGAMTLTIIEVLP